MKIHIKNMVCPRCVMAVRAILENIGLHPIHIGLGEVELEEDDISGIKSQLKHELQSIGFDLLDDKNSKIIERIKNLITELIQTKNNQLKLALSEYLTGEMNHDYSWLSNLFSEVEGITIEKYYIFQKIEKVKELLIYDELSLSEIAYQLNYSSPAYLSSQFKKVTGLTPSHFRNLKENNRKSIDEI